MFPTSKQLAWALLQDRFLDQDVKLLGRAPTQLSGPSPCVRV